MNLSYRIAKRYFLSYRKRSFISIIALIAMVGIGVGTMAMVIVLSVFNGMEDLNRQIFKSFDPDIKIAPIEGRRFEVSDSLLEAINGLEGVQFATQVIEDNALASYDDQQVLIRLKGVDSTFRYRSQMDTTLLEGSLQLTGPQGTQFALISDGIRNALSISLRDTFIPFSLWYPKNDRKTLNFSNADAFNQVSVIPGGAFFIESRYDDIVFVPLELAQSLIGLDKERSSLEIQLLPTANESKVIRELKSQLGNGFSVKNRDEQNADLLRAIRVEKLFVTVTLSLIILVAAINIFFSLSMLTLEKKADTAILFAMGAKPSLVRQIFLSVGNIISFAGAGIGLLVGVLICLAQKEFGLVSMGMKTALVDAYPVQLQWSDVLLTAAVIVLITVLVSYIPALRAARQTQRAFKL
jgi:lipoprotein-releasing system permease protein